jgi:hypothetical protein
MMQAIQIPHHHGVDPSSPNVVEHLVIRRPSAGGGRPVVVRILMGRPPAALADVEAVLALAADRELVAVSVDGLAEIHSCFHPSTLGA